MQLNAFGRSLAERKIKSKLPFVVIPFLKWVTSFPASLLPSLFSFKICFLSLENPENHSGN